MFPNALTHYLTRHNLKQEDLLRLMVFEGSVHVASEAVAVEAAQSVAGESGCGETSRLEPGRSQLIHIDWKRLPIFSDWYSVLT